jgi:hypothetical protein
MSSEHAAPVPWFIRPADSTDQSFVFSSWLKSFRDAPAVEQMREGDYYSRQHARITRTFEQARVYVACDPSARADIWGYLVEEDGRVHFVYVKSAFRRFGIASGLWAMCVGLRVPHSHDTLLGRHLAKKFNSAFDPFLAR